MASYFPSRTLEITVISAEDLKIGGNPIKRSSLLFVSVKSDLQNIQSTKISDNGGSFPFWNEKLVVDLPIQAAFLGLEVQSLNSRRKMKTVGTVKFPATDFTAGYVPESHLQFLSYRLRDSKGERSGIINISVRVKVAATAGNGQFSMSQKQGMAPESGLPMTKSTLIPANNFRGGQVVVTGIPVWKVDY